VTGAAAEARGLEVLLRPGLASDVPELERFLSTFASDGTLLPRSREDLMRHVGGFIVATRYGRLVACGALHPTATGLGEIRTLAVDSRWRGAGIGGSLAEALLHEARRRGIRRVFCLTRRVAFFERHGFKVAARERFPQKIWNDCRLCPRLSRCDETAMERAL
jgi:amino-acid N-acetyltransferase